jgi:hypothetical protein
MEENQNKQETPKDNEQESQPQREQEVSGSIEENAHPLVGDLHPTDRVETSQEEANGNAQSDSDENKS